MQGAAGSGHCGAVVEGVDAVALAVGAALAELGAVAEAEAGALVEGLADAVLEDGNVDFTLGVDATTD